MSGRERVVREQNERVGTASCSEIVQSNMIPYNSQFNRTLLWQKLMHNVFRVEGFRRASGRVPGSVLATVVVTFTTLSHDTVSRERHRGSEKESRNSVNVEKEGK
jgi:hypothetical protein